jgi:type ISP restriction-modification system protein/N-6 DNA methylase
MSALSTAETFEQQLKRFANSLATAYTATAASKAQPEDQLKPPIVNLLIRFGELIGVELIPTTEAFVLELGARPDVAVSVDGAVTGHIELKAPGKGAQPRKFKSHDARQWKKFSNHPNLLYTDGNEWALYRTGERRGKIVRLAGDVSQEGAAALGPTDAHNLELLLRDFLSWQPIVPSSPRGLAEVLAPLCRLLRDDALTAVAAKGSAMHILADDWRRYLFADADDPQFADAYAQTVTYALLLARMEGEENLATHAVDRLEARHGLLAQVLRILSQREAREEVEVAVDLLERTIGAIDPEMMVGSGSSDPWLYFYEEFLAAYDRKLRNNRGVYYTPVQVVQAQVRLVTELLRDRFGKKLGIVDDDVVLLDPATGTGTYLLAALDEGLAAATERFGPGEAAGRATVAAANFHGFELLVGPYAVAHLRVAQRILDEGGTLPEDGTHVYLADTLESPFAPGEGKQTSLMHKKLSEENERARKIKADKRVLVCLGNPPYDRQQIDSDDDETQRKGGWVRFGDDGDDPILDAFIEPVREAGAGGQLKNLYNDYVYFWRWALWKVFEQSGGGGIVSFITASSYLRGPAFAGMRRVMRETFDEMWIIDLGGDNLGARKSENVFAIQTPVAIAIGVRTGALKSNEPAEVRYAAALVEGSQSEKLQRLAEISTFRDLIWEGCFSEWEAPLLPEREGNYLTWPKLTDIFPWQQSGVKAGRTWPIAPEPSMLNRRWQKLVTADPKQRQALFKDSPTGRKASAGAPGLPPAAKMHLEPIEKLSVDTPAPPIRRFSYRSLDRQYLFGDPRLLDRPGGPLWATHGDEQVFLTSLLTGVLGGGLGSMAASEIPDLHHFRGSFGAKDVIPLWRDAAATEANLPDGLLTTLARHLGEQTPEALFSYVYAVLAGNYTERFRMELEVPGPRIPLTKDKALFKKTAELGRRLIWLHTYGERFAPQGEKVGQLPRGSARCTNAVSGEPDEYPELFEYDAKSQRLIVGKGVFEPVAPEAWEFDVSGLQVVKSWLAYRMKDGAGKRSSQLDAIRPTEWPATFTEELCELLWVIEQTLELKPHANALLNEILEEALFEASELPIPTSKERAAPKVDAEDPGQLTLEAD